MIYRYVFFTVLVTALAGCSSPQTPATTQTQTKTDPQTQDVASAPTQTDNKDSTPTTEAEKMPEVPTLQVKTIDGADYDLAGKRGNWVVVNFWATWCAPCLKEIPDFNQFDAARKDVEFIGLAYEEISVADMQTFFKEKVKPDYPVSIVDPFNPPADFETPRGLPMSYLIAPDGKVARKFLGPLTSAEIASTIKNHNPR